MDPYFNCLIFLLGFFCVFSEWYVAPNIMFRICVYVCVCVTEKENPLPSPSVGILNNEIG